MVTILYVDDEEVNLRIFKNSFRREFNIIVATSAKEGLEILANHKVDLVITDQKMPNMTGFEFLKEVNRIFPNIPPYRLIISGYSEPESIEEAYKNYKLFGFISKPWNENELRKIIINATGNRNE